MTSRTFLRRGLVVATPIIVAALITACGSNGSSTGDGSSDDRNASPGPSLQLRDGVPVIAALVGLSEAEAEAEAEANGWTVRVVERDGEEYMVTMDYSDSRVNLTIEGGVVTNAAVG